MVKATLAVSLPAWTKVLHKGQSTDSLLKRLKDLQDTLTRAEADDLPRSTLEAVRDQLIQDDLLFHKGKDVRASLACCLADLLRLCAPEPPFNEDQLQTIFQFFLSVLTTASGGLSKPAGPLFNHASTLLENLVTTRSLLLMWDLDSADTLVKNYFTGFFGVMRPETPKKVELLASSALAMLVMDADAVSTDIIELLVAHFHPSTKRTNPAAAHLATLVCNEASSELQKYVSQYFADTILKAMTEEETPAVEISLQKTHALIIHINKSAPAVLDGVIPLLEDGLQTTNDTLREASVRTLGHMFAEKAAIDGGGGDLAQKFPTTWKTWLARCLDKSVVIRFAWVEATRGVFLYHPELKMELEACVSQKILDVDEKVRLAMIKVIGTLDYETLRHHVSKKLLQTVGDRTSDKRESVRLEALDVVGRAFSLGYPEMQSGDEAAKELFGWIPDVVVAARERDPARNSLVPVQHALAKYLLPLPKAGTEDEDQWTQRFLFVLQSLSEDNARSFAKVCNLVDPRHHWYQFLIACRRFNGGIISGSQEEVTSTKQALIHSIERIAQYYFSDPASAAKDLNEFAKQNDARSYKLLSVIMDPQVDLATSARAVGEMNKKLKAAGKGNTTMTAVVRLAGFPFLASSSVPAVLSTLQDTSDAVLRKRLLALVKAMADTVPSMLVNHAALFLRTLNGKHTNAGVAEVCLMALAKLQASTEAEVQVALDKSGIKVVRRYIHHGSHSEAKYAAKLLALLAGREDVEGSVMAKQTVQEICEEIARDLSTYNPARLVASMAALKQLVKHAKDALTDVNDVIVAKVLNDVLMKPWSEHDQRGAGEEQAEEWLDDDDMDDELRARVIALQFLTQRCLAYAEDEEVHALVRPVLRLLFTCTSHGEPAKTLGSNAAARARFRSVAAISILKLARRANCESHIGADEFQVFATTIQDETYQVRASFLSKMMKYWLKRRANLPPRYYVLGFMTAFDPEEELRAMVKNACMQLHSLMTQELRLKYFDVALARLIHLLHHYPDFADGGLADEDSLKSAAVYLDFYLDCCSSPANLACLYYIANRCKGHEDVMGGAAASEGIYRLSEVAMCLIKRRADAMGCNVGNWAGRVSLPNELYTSLPNRAEQNEIYKRSYLSDEMAEYFLQLPVKRAGVVAAKRKAFFRVQEVGSVAAKKARTRKAPTARRRRSSSDQADEDSVEEDSDEDLVAMEEESPIHQDDDEADVSEDEPVESSAEEAEGRGARLKEKRRRETLARNEAREKRRQTKAAVA